ncbi:hypothetical protein LXJ15735_28450 [Lacrimispora xylanolytica]
MTEFLKYMIGSIYKILPLNDANNHAVKDYIDSISIQLVGALYTFPELTTNQKYVSIINSVNFLRKENFTKRQCKREVLRCTNILQKMIQE